MTSRSFKRDPSYRLHKQSGQAIVTLADGFGGRRDFLLGPYGTPQSRAEYRRHVAEWEANGRRLPQAQAASDLSINELIVAFWPHAEQHYRQPDGTPTNELRDFRLSLKPLKRLYGHTAAADFGPLALKAVRLAMATGSWLSPQEQGKLRKHKRCVEWSRGVVNQRVGRIRRMFKWAVENELVSAPVYQGLMAVRGLQRGRSDARETDPVKPVPVSFVEAALPFLRPQVAAMAQLQLHAGMRPGEVVIMRGIDLDTSGKVWFYRPGSDRGPHGEHKTAWRGQDRIIALGPKAQAILKPWLRLNLQEYLFQPWEAVEELHAGRRQTRKSKVTPSQARRSRKKVPQRKPRTRYSVASYGKAILRAIDAANKTGACANCKPLLPAERCEACQASAIPHWHPHQLRHTKATEIRREAGLDAARAVLGHRSPAITEVYAELDMGKAAEIMERIG